METTIKLPGTGPASCVCGLHKDHCLFGRQHTWLRGGYRNQMAPWLDIYFCIGGCGAECTNV